MAAAAADGVPATIAGRFGGADLRLGAEAAPLADLSALYRGAFEAAIG